MLARIRKHTMTQMRVVETWNFAKDPGVATRAFFLKHYSYKGRYKVEWYVKTACSSFTAARAIRIFFLLLFRVAGNLILTI